MAKGASLIRMQNAKMICDLIMENLVTKFACTVFKEMSVVDSLKLAYLSYYSNISITDSEQYVHTLT